MYGTMSFNPIRGEARAHTRRQLTTVTRVMGVMVMAAGCACWAQAQDATPVAASAVPAATASLEPSLAHRPAEAPAVTVAPQTVTLSVPKGTPLHVALDQEVRVAKQGQPIQGHVVEPVYAFDKLVIPVGTKVTGQITQIESVSTGKRTEAALDADFTPARKVQVEFNQITLPDGKLLPVHTTVTPGSGNVVEFVSAADEHQGKGVKDAAAERTRQAKQETKQE